MKRPASPSTKPTTPSRPHSSSSAAPAPTPLQPTQSASHSFTNPNPTTTQIHRLTRADRFNPF